MNEAVLLRNRALELLRPVQTLDGREKDEIERLTDLAVEKLSADSDKHRFHGSFPDFVLVRYLLIHSTFGEGGSAAWRCKRDHPVGRPQCYQCFCQRSSNAGKSCYRGC